MNILIADSGATKTDWLFYDGLEFIQVRTQGLHPSTISEPADSMDIQDQVGHLSPDKVMFYGTGLGNPVSDEIIRRFLDNLFPGIPIEIHSDLEGAGRAFYGDGDGVVCILGTGSVCAKIQNGSIVQKSASLGFAIGDEGSAADLGRRLLKMYFRRSADEKMIQFIGKRLGEPEYGEMMNRIYTLSKPNRELASVAGKVLKVPFPEELNSLIGKAFTDFIKYQLNTLGLSGSEEICYTGRVADAHSALLINVMKEHGFERVEVIHPVISAWRKRLKQS
jgi:N-acetylglucosamine kinase-like BadF-type ATPase